MAYTSAKTGRRSGSAPGALHSLLNALTTASTASTHYEYELDRCYSNFGLQVITGSTKADIVSLQASLDGTNWSEVAGSTFAVATVGSGGMVWVTGKPALYIRAKAQTLPSTVQVDAYIAPGL